MTPDKIYAGYRYENNNEDLYARKTPLTNRDTEYIRKDIVDKTIELAEDHAMLAGMNKMEQQMMEKAYDTIMQFDELNDLVPTFEDMQKFGFKEGDKVKIIILKDNETSF